MKTSARITTMLISVLALLNVVFLPIYEEGGGLMPDSVAISFSNVPDILMADFSSWKLWAVQLTVLMFVPSVFMFLTAMFGSKKLFIASSLFGVGLWLIKIIHYVTLDAATHDIFDFQNGSIAIGMWVALLMFLVGFIFGLAAKKAPKKA